MASLSLAELAASNDLVYTSLIWQSHAKMRSNTALQDEVT